MVMICLNMTGSNSLKLFIQRELGPFPHFLIYAILEWFLIAILFLDGFLAFFSNEFAKFFELHIPCVLCSRVEHVLVHQGMNSYYNSIICEHHKKDVSSLAYCRVHRNLSDIRTMCEGCLLSFAREKEPDTESKFIRTVVADSSVDGDVMRCSCCGEQMKLRTVAKGMTRIGSSVHMMQPLSPRSPRSQVVGPRNEDGRPLQLQLKFMSGNDSEVLDEDYIVLGADRPGVIGREINPYDINEETKTPGYSRGNKFFGVPLDSSTPRLSCRSIRKSPLEKMDFLLESNDLNPGSNEETDSILTRLRKQVRLDQKNISELTSELEEERSASDIATNNAMAMITRLQAEKASVQMEASQYQRMMEEQAQYDQEAIQMLRDILMKRGDEMKSVEAELENYRYKFGIIEKDGYDDFDAFDDYQEFNSRTYSFISERYECETPIEGSNHVGYEEYSPRCDDGLEEDEEEMGATGLENGEERRATGLEQGEEMRATGLEQGEERRATGLEQGEERGATDEESSPSGLEADQRSQLLGLLTVLEKKMYLTANEEELELVSSQPNSEIGNHLLV